MRHGKRIGGLVLAMLLLAASGWADAARGGGIAGGRSHARASAGTSADGGFGTFGGDSHPTHAVATPAHHDSNFGTFESPAVPAATAPASRTGEALSRAAARAQAAKTYGNIRLGAGVGAAQGTDTSPLSGSGMGGSGLTGVPAAPSAPIVANHYHDTGYFSSWSWPWYRTTPVVIVHDSPGWSGGYQSGPASVPLGPTGLPPDPPREHSMSWVLWLVILVPVVVLAIVLWHARAVSRERAIRSRQRYSLN